ncbi:hypothetical protein [Sphaerisporangium sp. TRM90804]|uniref:hypothetical protein n=1 Tax=Sphaerisporangium sp. TRM90804 TaxID=3031113 RepID=UPI00244845E2|nr:hypothetical protein [Sphaerisporangium sp. TRM90804]MDH2430410.1 hypothetical protein [Sphaerisporangium sp. TRM90804]
MANLLLGGLWTLSVFAGWGLEAFCGEGETPESCVDRLTVVSTLSGMFAIVAACCTLGGLLPPVMHRYPQKSLILVGAATASWIFALGVLYVGGMVGR